MALSGPDTGGSQYFMTHAADPHLDGRYTVFGRVISGCDALDALVQGDHSSAFVVSSATSAAGRGILAHARLSMAFSSPRSSLRPVRPRAAPLAGAPTPRRMPLAELPPVHRKIVFAWDYSQPELRIRGDGVARISPPDSARLDFFVNGQGTGHALLVGDEIRLQGGQESMRDFLPPAPLLWAALGRLHVPRRRRHHRTR